MRKQQRAMWMSLGCVGVLVLGGLVVWAQRAWSVEVLAPPLAIEAAASPPAPPPTLKPEPPPATAILQEVRKICSLLRTQGMTMTKLARRLGTITEDLGSNVVFRPASPYFSEGEVRQPISEDGEDSDQPEDVLLTLTDSRQLPMSAVKAAFGPGREEFVFDHLGPPPLSFDLRATPDGPVLCDLSAESDWRVEDESEDVVIYLEILRRSE
jgi:hypothetical protein